MDEELSPVTARLSAMIPDTAKPERGDGRTVRLTKASAIRTEKQLELKRGQVPLGTLTVVAGRGGEGKSTWVLGWIAEGTHGRLEGDLHGTPITALIVSIEDSWSAVMVPRLQAAGADLDRVVQVNVDLTVDGVTRETTPTLPLDTEQLRRAVRESGAQVIVLDPASSFMSGDMNKRGDVRESLDPLATLAQEEGIAVVLIMHFNKGAGSPSDKLSGSHALRDATRSLLLVARDDNTDERVLTVDKSNYSAAGGQSYAFRIDSVTVKTDDGHTVEVGRSVELGETTTSVGEILNRAYGEVESSDGNAAQAFIYQYLYDSPGWEAHARDVIDAGGDAGFSEQQLTKARFRAKNPVVQSSKVGAGRVWSIRSDAPQDSNIPKMPGVETQESWNLAQDSESERSAS
ncbi:AAA family ATPase [Plantibacter sp. Leaf314]|uniref:AAA family ATPase n=1 Tax=Plantibacter sp. Leaf314 TaxID=1736333 RepID=UPI0006F1D34D|nr:AAA family ATPase [Plantibacter sp. Leaf314]KQQ51856.1 hypothetical protein ASF68_05480 [Plantibacter sp. Leaf314]